MLDRARANGDLREIEPIWDYYLPNKNEPLSPDKDSYLTNYAFSAVSTIDFGCEGIYVELFLEGQLTSPEMTAAPSAHSRRFGTTPRPVG